MTQAVSSFSLFYGLPNTGAAGYFASKKYLAAGRSLVYITSQQDPEDVAASLQTFSPQTVVFIWTENPLGQAAILHGLLTAQGPYALTAASSLWAESLPAAADFRARTQVFRPSMNLRRSELVERLESLGYTREDYTENAGQYALRGSVVDIFTPLQRQPQRLYFAGNRLESIRSFDIDTQYTQQPQTELIIVPLVWEEKTATLADYTVGAQVLLDEIPDEISAKNFPPDTAVISRLPSASGTDCRFKTNIAFQGNFDLLDKETASLQRQGVRPVITCLNRGELDRLSDLLQSYPHAKDLPLQIAPLTQGFYQVEEKLAFITSAEILNRRYHPVRTLKNFTLENAQKVRFQELRAGDYVVHQTHGIGKYVGLEIMDKENNPTDCLIIQYRRGGKLYVPMYEFRSVQKYIGAGGKAPALSLLGGRAWQEIKARVKEEAQKTAQEILKLEAKRQAAGAEALLGDSRIEQEFADSFPFTLTAGQSQAIEDVLRDLGRERSMDRVLVGDVGFGKTEVAMRAAMRAVLSGKQVMMLVPTTILADQHYKTFTQRMAGFPVHVQMLCRFQTPKEQKEVIEQVKSGVCDIIIGTHRLLSKDISFAQLGLVMIDEEHRFGVKQKEKIKAKCAGVHTLLLSATPIPRTLNQSLSSLRDISLIDTPPRGRTPIQTVVTAWNNELAGAAISQELARGGQVYYVYNSVQSMESRLLFLKQLVPQARICMAHGQMKESELEQTVWDFNKGKYDILLASTIIESGIDITNANTLIVENAQNFGLAQLYQLRGRIGRGDKKAYCYLFHPEGLFKKPAPQPEDTYDQLLAMPYKPRAEKDPTEEAQKRLAALMEFSDLGSGFKLALRDMEIRGAGQLLGVKQHGYANDVGLSLYCDLIAQEVKKLKGKPLQKEIHCAVNLPLAAYIPPDYLPDDSERLKIYKELMSADEARTKKILDRLVDWAGPLPQEIKNLQRVLAISRRGGKLYLCQIDYAADALEFLFVRGAPIPPQFPQRVLEQYGSQVQFIKTRQSDGLRFCLTPGQAPIETTEQILSFLEAACQPKML